MQVDTFGVYVKARLEGWGREFALHRDCDYLGHRSKDMLQVLIEHKGELPPKVVGFKPLETDPMAQQIEDIVRDIARHNVERACILRGYYCGMGRKAIERREVAESMIRRVLDQSTYRLSRPRFFAEEELGRVEIRGVLTGISLAA
ncbi:hypothetical protein [Pseudoxanthomonas indica]|uniref:Uncharacterized protein n=1 Tax=Pseudoxanthomonas indica TaxID=428993 RepID=A0A1T5JD56_9GAMM|nr:hypothetical protein [Pseudoxanthomonas indica]GGD57948.1 hypothetical protein GCM10007235_32770 [Pseudoxanthomonas indica]SKC49212.1 hypothetical protein SAMN06296058_0701 [Pseudoxanthomonas indica]